MELGIGILVFILVFVVAFSMTLVGKGGGNFYVLILIFAAIPLEEAATTGQFILSCASFAGMFVFSKGKAVQWKLAIPVAILVALSAFAGGFLSHLFDEVILKVIFALLLVVSGIVMLVPYKSKKTAEGADERENRFGHVIISTADMGEINLNLLIVVPITIATGFFSGMLGISGGSFMVPMLVLSCGIPMKTSVTTVTPLVAISALMGFSGHALQGSFNPYISLPLAVVTVIGGLLGGKFALKSKPKHLKRLFAISNMFVAILILFKTFIW
ncbi:MAG: sulfite exporter TauE/SafE family protein [Candidatus Helarchaeales archaeon]